MLSRKFVLALSLLAVVLGLGMALTASERSVVYRGSDFWQTLEDGTYVDFSEEAIPAGFLCSGSAPFTRRIDLMGEPLETDPAGVFGPADTIVERLDDAVFNEQGVARTRVQMRALSLISIEPVQTECGSYRVTVGLDGEQPVTEMQIVRDGIIGGYFLAPLELNARISFWPVTEQEDFRRSPLDLEAGPARRSYRPLQIVQFFRLGVNPRAGWTFFPGQGGLQHEEAALVDQDGDGRPETRVPGTSNFAGGWWDMGGVPSRTNIYLASSSTTTNAVSAIEHLQHVSTSVFMGKKKSKGSGQ